MKHPVSIRSRILLLAIIPALAIALVLDIYWTRAQLDSLAQAQTTLGRTLVSQLAPASEYALYTRNRSILAHLAQAAQRDAAVQQIRFLDRDGNILAQAGKTPTDENSHKLEFTAEVKPSDVQLSDYDALLTNQPGTTVDDETALLGRVVITLTDAPLHQERVAILWQSALITLMLIVVTALIAARFSVSLTVPLLNVMRTVRRFQAGDMEARVPERSSGELGRLEHSINAMAESVRENQDNLQREIDQATEELRQTLEAVEVKNVELDLARKRAVNANRIKTEFLANVSHEIRTPMNAIIGFSRLLEKTELRADQKDYILTIRKAADSLLRLLDNVLNLSRIESGKLVLQSEPFDPVDVIETAVEFIAPEAQQKNLLLRVDVSPSCPLHIVGDAGRLEQVLLNLLRNAVKFTHQGEIKVYLECIDGQNERPRLRFTVTDTGIGMAPEQLQRLFKPFQQLDSTLTKSYEGVGLGLAITQKLCELMGGSIEVRSDPGLGTTFSVELPFGQYQDSETATSGRLAVFDPDGDAGRSLAHRLMRLGFTVAQFTELESLTRDIEAERGSAYNGIILTSGEPVGMHRHQLQHVLEQPVQTLLLLPTLDKTRLTRISARFGIQCLPITTPVAVLRDILLGRAPRADGEGSASDHLRPAGTHVMVVEDNPVNARLMRVMLENLGFGVELFATGHAALEAAREHPPSIALVDLHLPDMSGAELAVELRKTNENLMLVAVTASTNDDTLQHARQSGFDEVLIKPFEESALLNLLRQGRIASPLPPVADAPPNPLMKLDKEMRDSLRSDLQTNRADFHAAHERGDWDAAFNHVHRINGSAAFCKLEALRRACEILENQIRNAPSKVSTTQIAAFDTAVDAICQDIDNLDSTDSATILLADDNEDNRKLMKSFISESGAQVVEATTGLETLKAARERRFDVIVVDIHMPGATGVEVARDLRRNMGPNQDTPIIAVSANSTPDMIAEAKAAGIDQYLVKPFNEQELNGAISEHLAARQPNA